MICNLFTAPSFFIFSPDVPALLYYSHVPAILVAALVGMFVFLNGRHALINRLLLAISLSFSTWAALNLFLWTGIRSDALLFTWTFDVILTSLIAIFSVYFMYVFLDGHDVSSRLKSVFLALLIPAFLLAPTHFNLGGFDITNCDAFIYEGMAYKIYYVSLNALAILWILALLIRRYTSASEGFRRQILLMGAGMEFFLFTFFSIVFLADYLTEQGILPNSQMEFFGLFGMVVFMAFIAYLIVKFKTFNISLLASQVLIVAQVILIGSEFLFADKVLNQVLIGFTLALTGAMGIILIRSVRKEVESRKRIEVLAKNLADSNERQEGLIKFLSHEVKGFITRYMGFFAGLADGDFGKLPVKAHELSEQSLTQSRDDVRMVMDILQAANIKRGGITLKKEPFDLVALAREVMSGLEASAKAKGLSLSLDASDSPLTVNGDKAQIGDHVIKNLVQNAIIYTLHGSVTVRVALQENTVVFLVKDTGIGLSDADKQKLFTEGGRGEESMKVNVHSTGYGLFISKAIVEGHGGTIRAESEGRDKGSTFIVTLPAAAKA